VRLSHFILFLRPITRPLAREEQQLTHITELAWASGAEEKEQEREKNGTSGVHGGGYFAPHDTNNNFSTEKTEHTPQDCGLKRVSLALMHQGLRFF
jgi:hypothetical protein